MDNRLFSSNYIAIPLLANENLVLSPQPNWIVIDNIFGKLTQNLPELGETICSQSIYKIVYREILPENVELGRTEEMREIIYEQQNQAIPINVISYFSSHQSVSEHITEINYLLSLFHFRGVLSEFNLIIDEVKLNEILNS